jgi:hypothetical protein
MINKENGDKKPVSDKKDDKFVDTARMDVQCHIVIRDKETKQVLLNKRG